MKKKTITSTVINTLEVLLIMSISVSLFSCKKDAISYTEVNAKIVNDSLIKRGHYLVDVIGCNDCHSPKIIKDGKLILDPERILSGFPEKGILPNVNFNAIKNGEIGGNTDFTAVYGPWGLTLAANITSDDTGIGSWSYEQFDKALRHGKYKGLDNSRNLMPPMPTQNFINMTDDDIKAIFYYLKSTKPVINIVPPSRAITELIESK